MTYTKVSSAERRWFSRHTQKCSLPNDGFSRWIYSHV
uniref:Uncharacterized protein n=1 Tax=Siphoviridae sp. ctL0q1 TaxID=2825449 RepID=A0A8S5PKI2_9CAUD|nr:MAG TPA: hypothetical protein [Siphoviridae sp. ctL0q1]